MTVSVGPWDCPGTWCPFTSSRSAGHDSQPDSTGIEDFRWEKFYVLGPGDRKEYERLKRTQPSYQDRYDLLRIDLEIDSEWMLFRGEDIVAFVRRKSDGREFCLGLAELKATDRKSANHQLLDDYAVWFVNHR